MIYFNVVKTEQLEIDTETETQGHKTETETPGCKTETETETQGLKTESETLKFESWDVSRSRLESRELHPCISIIYCRFRQPDAIFTNDKMQ